MEQAPDRIRTYVSAARAAACLPVCMLASSGAGRSPPAGKPGVSPFWFSESHARVGKAGRWSAIKELNLPAELSSVLTQSYRAFVSSPRGARVILISVALGCTLVMSCSPTFLSLNPVPHGLQTRVTRGHQFQFSDASPSGRIVRLPLVWRSIT